MTTLVLDIDQCEKVRSLAGSLPYKNTKEGSRYEGKEYRTFIYNGKAFTIPTEDKFCADIDADNLFEVELEDTEEGYNFVSHRTITRAMATHKTKVAIKAYTVEYVQSMRESQYEELA